VFKNKHTVTDRYFYCIFPLSFIPFVTAYLYIRQVSERSETGGDYVFTFVCMCLCAFSPIGLNGRNVEKYIRLVREKLRIFPYGQHIVGNDVLLAV